MDNAKMEEEAYRRAMRDLAYVCGSRIRELRDGRGMTREQLADALKIGHTTLYRWENGERIPGSDDLFQISRIFNVKMDYFFADEAEKVQFQPDAAVDGLLAALRQLQDENKFLKTELQKPLDTSAVQISIDRKFDPLRDLSDDEIKTLAAIAKLPPEFVEGLPKLDHIHIEGIMALASDVYERKASSPSVRSARK